MSLITTDTSNGNITLNNNYTSSGICLNKFVDLDGLKNIVQRLKQEMHTIVKDNCKLQPTIERKGECWKIPLPFTVDDKVYFISIGKDKMREAMAWSFDAEGQLEDLQLDTRIYYEHLGVYC